MTTSGQATSSKLALSDSVLISMLKGETEVQRGGSLSAFEKRQVESLWIPLSVRVNGATNFAQPPCFPSQHLPRGSPQEEAGPPRIREDPSRTREEPTYPLSIPTNPSGRPKAAALHIPGWRAEVRALASGSSSCVPARA